MRDLLLGARHRRQGGTVNKCESCIRRTGADVENCLQCRAAAPSGANAALAIVLALLFTMAVVAVVEAARFGSSGEGVFATLLTSHNGPPPEPPPAAPGNR